MPGWHVKNDSRSHKKSTYGFSAHTGVDEDGFIHRQSVTPRHVHDSQERDTLLLGDESYSSKETRDTLERWDIDDQVQRKGYRNHPLSELDKKRNAEIAVTRSGGATFKQYYKLARTRFLGLAKNKTFYGLTAIAANIRKGVKFLGFYEMPESIVLDRWV